MTPTTPTPPPHVEPHEARSVITYALAWDTSSQTTLCDDCAKKMERRLGPVQTGRQHGPFLCEGTW